MVIFGGIDDKQQRLNDTWFFDFTSREWKKVLPKINDFYLPRPRSGHSACLFDDEILIVFGGMNAVTKELDDVVALDLITSEWS